MLTIGYKITYYYTLKTIFISSNHRCTHTFTIHVHLLYAYNRTNYASHAHTHTHTHTLTHTPNHSHSLIPCSHLREGSRMCPHT